MDVSSTLGQLNLGSKPWLGRSASPERLSELLTGRSVREHWKYTPITRFVDAFLRFITVFMPSNQGAI